MGSASYKLELQGVSLKWVLSLVFTFFKISATSQTHFELTNVRPENRNAKIQRNNHSKVNYF